MVKSSIGSVEPGRAGRAGAGEQLRLRVPADGRLVARPACTAAEVEAALRLRYDVFVGELGSDGPLVDHAAQIERDRFDAYAEHVVLLDPSRGPDAEAQVVGTYRVLDAEGAARAGGFYTAGEYDLAPLERSGRRLLEFGRSCLHPAYRGGAAMVTLWSALARLVRDRQASLLFGVASFHGADPALHAEALALLHARHLAPPELRARALPPGLAAMDAVPVDRVDRVAAMRAIPALLKAYLKLGGFVGEGAFVDRQFNTTDVLVVLDVERINPHQGALYGWTARA